MASAGNRVTIHGARPLPQHVDSSRSPTEALLGEVAFVHRLARALMRDDGLAHDVAQDALTAALQQQPVRHVRGWLAAATRHLAGRAGREARERASREAQAARPPSGDGEARTAERLRLHRRLCDAVMGLPEPYRTAVTLRFFDELPPRAIAKRLGLPAVTVRQHVHRGLAMLRQQLDREFGGGPGGRDGWRSAFAAVGLGKTTVPVLLWLPVLAMKKVVVGAALVAAVAVGWWSLDREASSPATSSLASAPSAQQAVHAVGGAPAAGAPLETERTPVPVPGTERAFVVRVVDEREQPIPGADVRCWTAAGASTKQRTDRDGRAEFTPLDGSGGLLVRADGFAPLVHELTQLRGEQRCTMPDGAILDGAMLVDGAPAPAGLRLCIHAPLLLPESAPRSLRDEFSHWRPSATALTAPGGTFVFRGLAGDRKVRLELPRTHWLLPEEGRIPEDSDEQSVRQLLPGHRVLLQTTQLPTVHGRVVWADDGTPVCEPEATVFATFANGDGSPGLSFVGHDDGTFATGFYPSTSGAWLRWCDPTKRTPLASVTMSVEAAGSEGSVRLDLDEKGLAAMPVEVRLPRAVITHFLVTDQDDRPIAGARVSATPSTPSDEHGRGTFQGKRGSVLVGADGYQVQPAASHRPAAGTENDPLRFRLAQRNHLVLTVRTAAGGVPPVRFVRILSRTGHLFCGKRFHNSFDETFGGSDGNSYGTGRTQADGSTEMGEWGCTTRPDANGRSELHSLEPGVPCTAEASDSCGSVVATASFVMPAPGETCTIDLVVTGTPRTVRGRVLARDGTPLPNAVVGVDPGSSEVRTGADGSFCFQGIYGSGPLRLTTKVAGYVEAEKEISVTDEVVEHVLVLDPAQRVTLRVVDEQGRPVETDARAEQVPGRSLHPQTVQMGEHLFTDLPSGIVTFEVAFGGAKFRVQHDTANPNVMLRVPRPGRVVVGPLKDGGGKGLSARGTRLDAAGEPFYLRVGASDAEAELVVPGRYRVELIRVTWRGHGETRERIEETVAPAQEIEARAGELVRIAF